MANGEDRSAEDRLTHWVTGFDDEDVERFGMWLERRAAERAAIAPVVIHTLGGSVLGMLAMIDLIRWCPIPVATIALGAAMSAGAMLLAAGTPGLRWVAPNASVMVHEMSDGVRAKAHEFESYAAETKRQSAEFWALLDEHTQKPKGWWAKAAADRGFTDWYMTAADVVTNGLADKVGVPTFSTETHHNHETNVSFHERKRPARKRGKR